MYDFDFVSQYKSIEQEYLKTHDVKEVEMLCDELYRYELLKIFGMTELNIDLMNSTIDDIWEQLKMNTRFYNCVQIFKKNCIFDDDIMALTMLFNYDSLFIVHACISDILKFNTIEPINLTKLENFVRLE